MGSVGLRMTADEYLSLGETPERRRGELLVEQPVTGDSLASAALPGFVLDLVPLRALATPG